LARELVCCNGDIHLRLGLGGSGDGLDAFEEDHCIRRTRRPVLVNYGDVVTL
jgi:hypothetical protein